MSEITGESFESLAQKLEALDLSEHESQVLDVILQRAAAIDTDDDVSGFWFGVQPQPYQFQSAFAQRLGVSAGFGGVAQPTTTETEIPLKTQLRP